MILCAMLPLFVQEIKKQLNFVLVMMVKGVDEAAKVVVFVGF